MQELEGLRSDIIEISSLESETESLSEMAKIAGSDRKLAQEIEKQLAELEKKASRFEFESLFQCEYDQRNAILSIHSAAGGVDAQDWAQMLLRMYLRYGDKKSFKTKIVDQTVGQEAGLKSVTIEVFGDYAFGNLKSEAGVHRLVRISPFDAEKMRHTSFALVEVLPILAEENEVEIKENDLKIEVFRAGGHGGQSVNTTDSAVRITHRPTGLTVKCQNERSQLQNKKTALKILQAKLMKFNQQTRGQALADIRGELLAAEWGNQIRSYVLQPYKLVKDHRTDFETKDPQAVLDGELDDFIKSYLRYISQQDKQDKFSAR